MVLIILLGGVWPVVCVAGATFVVVRDRQHRETSVQRADDYAHEAWGYLCEIRDIAEAIPHQPVTDEVGPASTTGPIPPVHPNPHVSYTCAQEYRSHGVGRHHLFGER
jgi:hypothetical protein